MLTTNQPGAMGFIGRGMLAGVAGTVVMIVFQKLIEMPITGRGASYSPASFTDTSGTAYGIAAIAGLRGQKAVNTVFATVYTFDVLLNTAVGLYHPKQWSPQDWAVDVVDKYVQAQATGLIFDRLLHPAR